MKLSITKYMNTHLNINQKNKLNLCSEQPYFTVAHIHQCLSTNHCDQVLPVYTVVMSAPDEEKEFFFFTSAHSAH